MRTLALFPIWLASAVAGATAQTLVADIHVEDAPSLPSAEPAEFTQLDRFVFFRGAIDSVDAELWRTDGTPEGTGPFFTIRPGPRGSNPHSFHVAGSLLFFVADDGVAGRELWVTDGTVTGTELVKDITTGPFSTFSRNGPAAITVAGDKVYFQVRGELWVSNGTAAGTFAIVPANAKQEKFSPGGIGELDGRAVFLAEQLDQEGKRLGLALWSTNGTTASTRVLRNFGTEFEQKTFRPDLFFRRGRRLYFPIDKRGLGQELMIFDGQTSSGTFLDLIPGAASSAPRHFAALDEDAVLFTVGVGIQLTGSIYRSEGTAESTKELDAGFTAVGQVVSNGSTVYFLGNKAGTPRLYHASGTTLRRITRRRFRPIIPTNIIGFSPSRSRPTLYFTFEGQIWRTSGSRGSTRRAKTLQPGFSTANPGPAAVFRHGRERWMVFAASGKGTGRQPYRFDTDVRRTVRVRAGRGLRFRRVQRDEVTLLRTENVPQTGSHPADITATPDGGAILSATVGNVSESFETDGTQAGTRRVGSRFSELLKARFERSLQLRRRRFVVLRKQRRRGLTRFGRNRSVCVTRLRDVRRSRVARIRRRRPTAAGDDLVDVIVAVSPIDDLGVEMVIVDPETLAITVVADVHPNGDSDPDEIVYLLDRGFVFVADDGQNGRELHVAQPFGGKATRLTDIGTGAVDANANELTKVGERVFFVAVDDRGPALWLTDGTRPGTRRIRDFTDVPGELVAGTVQNRDVVFFRASDASGGEELWMSDGTSAGTRRVHDIAPGAESSSPAGLVWSGSKLFFVAWTPTAGTELWSSDGTTAGTRLVLDARPGEPDGIDSFEEPIRQIDSTGRVAFVATLPDGVPTIYVSDGTPAGTAAAFRPNFAGLGPRNLGVAGNRLYFAGNDFRKGYELFAIDLAALGATIAEPYGAGCPGGSGHTPATGSDALPTLGNARFGVTLRCARPSAAVALLLGRKRAELPLSSLCDALVDQVVFVLPGAADPSGDYRQPLPIPTDVRTLGGELFAQFLVLDPGGGALGGLALSDALAIMIGK